MPLCLTMQGLKFESQVVATFYSYLKKHHIDDIPYEHSIMAHLWLWTTSYVQDITNSKMP